MSNTNTYTITHEEVVKVVEQTIGEIDLTIKDLEMLKEHTKVMYERMVSDLQHKLDYWKEEVPDVWEDIRNALDSPRLPPTEMWGFFIT